MPTVTMTVNGKQRSADAETRTLPAQQGAHVVQIFFLLRI